VSFYWAEAEAFMGGCVPVELTERVNDRMVCMQGTNSKTPRCVALCGEVGVAVSCSIYPQRPTPCREFPALLDDGRINPECQRIRAIYGLPPIHPPTTPSNEPPIEPQVA